MPSPRTVAEYRAQVPNASPCPHSAKLTDPPCDPCVMGRIQNANALRAGVDTTTVPPSPEVAAHEAAQVGEQETTPVGSPQPAAASSPMPEDQAPSTPMPEPASAPSPAPVPMTVSHEALGPEHEESFLPGMTTTPPAEVDPLVPSFSQTPPVGLAADIPLDTEPELDEVDTPNDLEPLDLALEPDQLERRAAIEAGTHPAVAPLAPPPPPEPAIEERTPVKTYDLVQRNNAGQLYGWDADDQSWELIDEDLYVAALGEDDGVWGVFHKGTPAETEEQAQARRDAEVEAKLAATAPDAQETPQDALSAPAPAAAPEPAPEPVSVAMGDLPQPRCPHDMPATDLSSNPPRSASCVDCMNDGGAPPAATPLKAFRFLQARFETDCARPICKNRIMPGDFIGEVEGLGFCCPSCSKPVA